MQKVERIRAALLGAVVGDAATLGFHWLYDSARIEKVGGATPEFHTPNPADYEGTTGYFAARGKQAGDLSAYGAHLLAAVRSVTDSNARQWSTSQYLTRFVQTFERGGTFNGYIDSPTQGTLDKLQKAVISTVEVAIDRVKTHLTADQCTFFRRFLAKQATDYRGKELVDKFSTFIGVHAESDSVRRAAADAAEYYDSHRPIRVGADDNQSTGFVKIPAVVPTILGHNDFDTIVEEAVRATNDNDECVTYSVFAARVLEAVLQGSEITVAVDRALALVADKSDLHENIRKAIVFDVRTQGAAALAKEFGSSCAARNCIPTSIAIVTTRDMSFSEAIRLNIQVGGDSPSRAVFIGAVLGARFGIASERGVPLTWVGRVRNLQAVLETVEAVALQPTEDRDR
jgi:ADP-ribosylglycohydrolase